MDRNEIRTALGGLFDEHQISDKLMKSLAKKLKDRHPIHKKLKTFSNPVLNKLLVNLSLPVPKHRARKMKAISNHFFRKYPDAPLTNLKRVMDEDAYFAQLTSIDDVIHGNDRTGMFN